MGRIRSVRRITHRTSGPAAILSALVIALAACTSPTPKATHFSPSPSSSKSTGPFAGWVNGIYIYPDLNAPAGFVPDKAVRADPTCPRTERIVSEHELRASGYYIDTPAWMPPGAAEQEGAWAGACGTKIIVVSRQFGVADTGASIGLVLRPGARTAQFDAVAQQIEATTVNGRPAVAIKSLTGDGSGNTVIFILTGKGLLQVGAYDVRFTDLKRVAESIE